MATTREPLMQNRNIGPSTRRRLVALMVAAMATLVSPAPATAQLANLAIIGGSLRGSKSSIERMHDFAVRNGFRFARTASDVDSLAARGRLIPLGGSQFYEVSAAVGFAYATPEARAFLDGLAPRFLEKCSEPLVVTSATRPQSRQPRNAAELSVHPTGIAVDLRRPRAGPCLSWLRDTLLVMESDGQIEVTEERRPPHFHIAVLAEPGSAPVPGLIDRLIAGQLLPPNPPDIGVFRELEQRDEPNLALAPLFQAPMLPSESFAALTGLDLIINIEDPLEVLVTGVSAGDVEVAPDSAKSEAVVERRATTHTVRSGDTLWDIARKYDLSVGELQRANNLGKKSRIKPKMKLKIPG